MPFYIAYPDVSTGVRNAATEVQLSPGPARIAYPDGPAGSLVETAAGAPVQQQPTIDGRTRTWFWDNYPAWYTPYQALWAIIEPLRSRYRKLAGAPSPYVYLRDTETQLLRTIVVSGTTVTPTYAWLRCRVLDVSRQTLREGSGLVVYAATRLVFVVEDPNANDLL